MGAFDEQLSTAPAPPDAAGAPGVAGSGPPVAEAGQGPWALAWRRFRRQRPAVTGALVLVALALAVACAPLVAAHDPTPALDAETLAEAGQPPSAHHWLGTDQLGRDQLARVLYGGRISLVVGLCVAVGSTALGAAVGAVAGYRRGWIDEIVMRITDLVSIIPALAVLMIARKGLGGSVMVIIAILTLVSWPTLARVVRSVVASLGEKEFVEAARASGASGLRIVMCHLLPNAVGPVCVHASLAVGAAILAESALSFLGFGLQPPAVSWGGMLAESRGAVGTDLAYLFIAPGLAIFVTVVAVNLVGNGLRDALDPRADLSEPRRRPGRQADRSAP